MNIYRSGNCWHRKNTAGFYLVKSANMSDHRGQNDGVLLHSNLDIDIVYKYDKVICGPHTDFYQAISFFKEYKGERTIYWNVLSNWQKELFERYAPNPKVKYVTLAFPVDTVTYTPSRKEDTFFIYVKLLHSSKINELMSFMETAPIKKLLKNYECKIFNYGSYKENEYLDFVKKAKFGIWLGRHESQGFAFEEAMSCNCPLYVYDIQSLKDECINDREYPWAHLEGDYPATAAAYFDDTCGKKVLELTTESFTEFFIDVATNKYEPREYVLQNLTEKNFLETIKTIFLIQ